MKVEVIVKTDEKEEKYEGKMAFGLVDTGKTVGEEHEAQAFLVGKTDMLKIWPVVAGFVSTVINGVLDENSSCGEKEKEIALYTIEGMLEKEFLSPEKRKQHDKIRTVEAWKILQEQMAEFVATFKKEEE